MIPQKMHSFHNRRLRSFLRWLLIFFGIIRDKRKGFKNPRLGDHENRSRRKNGKRVKSPLFMKCPFPKSSPKESRNLISLQTVLLSSDPDANPKPPKSPREMPSFEFYCQFYCDSVFVRNHRHNQLVLLWVLLRKWRKSSTESSTAIFSPFWNLVKRKKKKNGGFLVFGVVFWNIVKLFAT